MSSLPDWRGTRSLFMQTHFSPIPDDACPDPDERREAWLRWSLRKVMEMLSEDTWAATWVFDLEYRLWLCLLGQWDRIDANGLKALRELGTLTNGWWIMDEETGEKVFIRMEEWLQRFADWERTKRQEPLSRRYEGGISFE